MLALFTGCSAKQRALSEADSSAVSVSETEPSEVETPEVETSETQEADSDDLSGVLPGNYWTGDDDLYFCLGGDETFMYYQSVQNKDNYYSATYKAYCSMAAVNYIAEDLSEYGLTKEEQTNFGKAKTIVKITITV